MVFANSSFAQDYLTYHQKATEAELAILDSNYIEAAQIYYNLLEEYDFVFLGTCVTACQTAIVLENDTLAFYFLERAAKQGLKMTSILSDGSLNHLTKTDQWNGFMIKYDSIRDSYLNSIDLDLRTKVNSLYAVDQKWRNKHENHPWNFLWRPFIRMKWNSVLEKLVEQELVPLIETHGYPGEKLIGVIERSASSPIIKFDHYNDFTVRLILMHYYSKPRRINDSIFLPEIGKGNLHPKQYADFHDFQSAYTKKKSPLKNQFLCQWMIGEKSLNKTTKEKVNAQRASIGLGNYDDRIRERTYFIKVKGYENRKREEPYVKIYY